MQTAFLRRHIQINARNAIAGRAGFVLCFASQPTTTTHPKLTHLRVEALGHNVVVVRRLLGHGGQWGTRGAFLGLVNEEPICRIENSKMREVGVANTCEREKWSKIPAHHVLKKRQRYKHKANRIICRFHVPLLGLAIG